MPVFHSCSCSPHSLRCFSGSSSFSSHVVTSSSMVTSMILTLTISRSLHTHSHYLRSSPPLLQGADSQRGPARGRSPAEMRFAPRPPPSPRPPPPPRQSTLSIPSTCPAHQHSSACLIDPQARRALTAMALRVGRSAGLRWVRLAVGGDDLQGLSHLK